MMKDSTAYRKLDRVMIASREYIDRLFMNGRDTKAEEKIFELRAYAKKMILRRGLDYRRYKSLFCTEEYEEIARKLNPKDHAHSN